MHVRTWTIGLFIIVGFALFTATLFLIGDRQKAFSKHLELYTQFSNIGGLASGAKVRVSGLDAGKLKRIEIPKGPTSNFRLELEVEDKVRGMIRQDSVVSIETEGVVGDKFISIRKGSSKAGEIAAGSTLPSKEPLDLAALLEKGSGMMNDVHSSVKDIRGRVDVALDSITKTVNHADGLIVGVQPNIQKIAKDGGEITGKVNTLASDLNEGKGAAGMLLKDERTRQQVQDTLSNIQQTSANLNQSSIRVDKTIADFQSRNLVAKTDATLDNVQTMSQDLNATIKEALAEDGAGQNGGTNLRETLSNLNRTAANLADDTEALKHNFFFRGFFKKRGFYSLEQLTPANYTEACERMKDTGTRKWFSATELFSADATGRGELTAAGRGRIDSELASGLDSLPAQIVVVEGYAAAGPPEQQVSTSRWRADHVRRYLEEHYHLRRRNVGTVAMRNVPPAGTGRTSWDGAAIMIIDPNKR